MLRCEINRNIMTQMVEIYLIDKHNYFVYNDGQIEAHERKEYVVDGMKPFLKIYYDVWDAMEDGIKKHLEIEKIEGSASHIKDLRWILGHFLDKDKK